MKKKGVKKKVKKRLSKAKAKKIKIKKTKIKIGVVKVHSYFPKVLDYSKVSNKAKKSKKRAKISYKNSEKKFLKKAIPKKKEPIFKDINDWISGSIGFETSIANIQKSKRQREFLKLHLRAEPIKYYHLSATFMKDTNDFFNKYYHPDFYYTFGYDTYQSDSWGFLYSNYKNNKFKSLKKDLYNNHFRDGTWEINYKKDYQGARFTTIAQYQPSQNERFLTLRIEKQLSNKDNVSIDFKHYLHYPQTQIKLSARHNFDKNFFVAGSAFFYSHITKQTNIEPDYSYYFGWENNNISITYSNRYTPTRWGWRKPDGPSFPYGRISLNIAF